MNHLSYKPNTKVINDLLLSFVVFIIIIYLKFGFSNFINDFSNTPIFQSLNNEISYLKLITHHNDLQNFLLLQSNDKFFANNLSIPIYYFYQLLLINSNNLQLVINLFVVLSFIFSALVANRVFLKLVNNQLISVVCTLLFIFSYYQTYKNSEIYLIFNGYCLILLYYALKILKNELIEKESKISLYLLSFLIPFLSLQYAAIWLIILNFIFLSKLLSTGFKQNQFILILIAALLIEIILVFQLNFYFFGLEINSKLLFSDFEYNQLKITQLFLPNYHHHNFKLAEITTLYQDTFYLNSNNKSVALGFISSFVLLYILFTGIDYSINRNQTHYKTTSTAVYVFPLCLFLIVFSSTGSISAFFSFMHRSLATEWYRSVIFANILILFVFQSILVQLQQKWTAKKFHLFLIFVLFFGIYDQTPKNPSHLQTEYEKKWESLQLLQKELNRDNSLKKVLQLPFVNPSDDFLKWYLYTENRLSFLVNNYNTIDYKTLQKLSYFSFPEQIKIAQQLDFNYLLINKTNFCDGNFKKISNIDFPNTSIIFDDSNYLLYKINNSAKKINNTEFTSDLSAYLKKPITNTLYCHP